MDRLSFDPLISLPLWLTIALAGAAVLAWYGWGRPGGVPQRRWTAIVGLAALGLALLLGILLNPTWVEPVPPPAGKPLVTILVDATASMATPDQPDGQTRYHAAAQLARRLAATLEDQHEVRLRTFAGTLTPVQPDDLEQRTPDGEVTDVKAALTGSLQESRPSGQSIVLFSDGIHNAGSDTASVLEAARLAKALACPVFTRTFGGDHAVKDLAIEARSPQEVAYVGQKIPVPIVLRQRGLAGARTALTLLHDGAEVERKDVTLTMNAHAEVRFQVAHKKPGLYRYEVRADAVPGEVSLANNTAVVQLRVVDRPIRALLLEGKPYWDGKFLVRTLIADPSIELDCLIRVSAGRLYRRSLTRALPSPDAPAAEPREESAVLSGSADAVAAEGLRSYQVILLGRDAEVFLTEATLKLLRSWLLEDGGCLVCYRGQPTAQVSQQLAQVLPVRWTPTPEARFRPALTERGRDLQWFGGGSAAGDTFAALPTLATSARPDQAKPLAVVLATAGASGPDASSPVVTFQPYGLGRVVTIEGGGMWRWAFLPPEQKEHEEVYRDLWHSLMRWLASNAALLPGQTLALRTDKVTFGTEESATATLLVRDEGGTAEAQSVRLTGESLAQPVVASAVRAGDDPGVFRIVFGKLPEGRYQAAVVGSDDPSATAAFDIRSRSDERLDLKARPELMARVAKESGGAELTESAPEAVVVQLREHLERDRPVQVRRLSAWDRWWVLLGVCAVWASAWAVRRSGGLV